jgi:alpha-beta hydrolase superfamily lysophospholipase
MVGLVLLAGWATGLVAYVVADHVLHPPRDVSPWTPADAGLAYARVTFPARDGIPLVGWWMPAQDARGTVVFLHGYGASKAQSLAVAPFLHAAGYNVLAYDARAHGESGGTHTTLGLDEVQDAEGAWDWLTARGETSRVALFGWSMGGATAINAAPKLPGVAAIIADSSFASLAAVGGRTATSLAHLPEHPFGEATMVAAQAMTGHAPGDDAPAEAARDAPQPLLIIQGGADTLVPPEQARQLQEAAGARATLWLVPGAVHIDAARDDAAEYEAKVLGFLQAALAQAS